jgi:uncharacterized protein (DUF169 family)
VDSKIARAVALKTSPVAVMLADKAPDGALGFVQNSRGCTMSMMTAASKGATAAFDVKTCGCIGGVVGLGFKTFGSFGPGFAAKFLSTGSDQFPGNRHRKSPAVAQTFVDALPTVDHGHSHVVFKPLDDLADDETPEVVVFLATPDQLSGLTTIANWDRPGRDATLLAQASACQATVLLPLEQSHSAEPRCLLGLTDPSARKNLDPNVLSFAVPWQRFLEMERNVDESFLGQEEWAELTERF